MDIMKCWNPQYFQVSAQAWRCCAQVIHRPMHIQSIPNLRAGLTPRAPGGVVSPHDAYSKAGESGCTAWTRPAATAGTTGRSEKKLLNLILRE
jgi:hypothetical protein